MKKLICGAAVVSLLAGCDIWTSLFGKSGPPTPQIFALTGESSATTATVTLWWPKVSQASIYEIYKQGGTAERISVQTATSASLSGTVDQSIGYFVRALGESGKSLGDSSVVSVTPISPLTAKPGNLMADGSTALPFALVKNLSPKLSWSAVPEAVAYRVSVTAYGDKAPTASIVTSGTEWQIGSEGSAVEVPEVGDFKQKVPAASFSNGLKNSTIYVFRVYAVRANHPTLKSATAIAETPSEEAKFEVRL